MKKVILFLAIFLAGCGARATIDLPIIVAYKDITENGCVIYARWKHSDGWGNNGFYTVRDPKYCEYQIGQEIK